MSSVYDSYLDYQLNMNEAPQPVPSHIMVGHANNLHIPGTWYIKCKCMHVSINLYHGCVVYPIQMTVVLVILACHQLHLQCS